MIEVIFDMIKGALRWAWKVFYTLVAIWATLVVFMILVIMICS